MACMFRDHQGHPWRQHAHRWLTFSPKSLQVDPRPGVRGRALVGNKFTQLFNEFSCSSEAQSHPKKESYCLAEAFFDRGRYGCPVGLMTS